MLAPFIYSLPVIAGSSFCPTRAFARCAFQEVCFKVKVDVLQICGLIVVLLNSSRILRRGKAIMRVLRLARYELKQDIEELRQRQKQHVTCKTRTL